MKIIVMMAMIMTNSYIEDDGAEDVMANHPDGR